MKESKYEHKTDKWYHKLMSIKLISDIKTDELCHLPGCRTVADQSYNALTLCLKFGTWLSKNALLYRFKSSTLIYENTLISSPEAVHSERTKRIFK